MSIEKKTGIFYEILIRGAHGAAHETPGLPLGAFVGGHYIEGEAIVEDGAVKLFTPGQAQELSREKIVDYLGEKFALFHEGHVAALADLQAKHAAHLSALQSEHEAQIAALQKDRDGSAEIQRVKQQQIVDQLVAERDAALTSASETGVQLQDALDKLKAVRALVQDREASA